MRLIDADALIKDLNEHKIPFNSDINEAIIFAPTIEAEPIRHGRWIHNGFMEVKCNNCGNVFHELEDTNYCSNCGAKMEADT